MPAAFQALQFQLHINLCIDTVCLDMALCSLVDTYHYFGGTCCVHLNTFTAIVDLSRSNFSIARAPFFQLKSAA